ncbi:MULTISPECIES: hypothetical protein [Pyrobaculum]|uniref:Uncharacterized protein n=2 Tax=Pyrobaculum arsenaticum TaxID=121277 RepID=A4WKL4_PYRAR|nr:hypothetical protein [Pyrobaculum arsenaticum]ABP50931.1 hypothetical protein Pars_1368 [Pyrobaculum arsenaticum DSM 13514]MCY0891279.1 hypothetical protein [Pyrobaculum arsenaticum]NYR15348.1 hypothetical protein [Pyrobaculum arsenaticum]
MEAARRIDQAEHSAYGRVYYPLMDLLLRDASEAEFAQFFTAAIFGDGSVYPHKVYLILGEFDSDELPHDRFHKLALWLAVAEKYRPVFKKYGVDITPSVYVGEGRMRLAFDPQEPVSSSRWEGCRCGASTINTSTRSGGTSGMQGLLRPKKC